MLQASSSPTYNRLVHGATWGGMGDLISQTVFRRYGHLCMSGSN
jgi:hypothetical protein